MSIESSCDGWGVDGDVEREFEGRWMRNQLEIAEEIP
jgi:hypothetical protein